MDALEVTEFRHTPLDHAFATIRLVRVLPSLSADGLIRCEISSHILPDDPAEFKSGLSTADLRRTATKEKDLEDETNRYFCLSYTWGDPYDQVVIIVNGGLFKVRKNLSDFLSVARNTLDDEFLWIDALCIDQSSLSERNHQVQQMGKIYSGARTVLTWLGNNLEVEYVLYRIKNAKRDSNLRDDVTWNRQTMMWDARQSVVDRFSSRARSLRSNPQHSQRGRAVAPLKPSELNGMNFTGGEKEFDILADNTGKVEKILEKLAENEYWSRAWVTQEVLLAKQVVLIAGHEAYPLLTLANMYRAAVPYFKDNAFENLIDLVLLQQQRKESQYRVDWDDSATGLEDWHIVQLLHRFRNKSCAIRRDRIYSLLALSRHGIALEVDYDVSEEQLMRQILSAHKESMCLCSTAIAAHALAPWEFPDIDAYDYHVVESSFAELYMYGCALSSATCPFCQNYTPSSWTRKRGIIFCLQTACPDCQGHVFLELEDSAQYVQTVEVDATDLISKGSVHTQLRGNNKSQLLCANGDDLRITQSEWKHLYSLRFTLRRLIEVLQDDINAGELGLNACGNLWPSASNAPSPSELRLRLCNGV